MTVENEKLPITDILELRKLLVNGIKSEIVYEIPFYKEVYDKSICIKLRPLSNTEFDDIFLEMCLSIDNKALQEELYSPKQKEEKKEENIEVKDDYKIGVNDLDVETENEEKEKDHGFSKLEYTNVLKHYKDLIIYNSMKDFVEGLTIVDIKKMDGKNDVYDKICEISGRTEEIIKKISRFRELKTKSEPDITS